MITIISLSVLLFVMWVVFADVKRYTEKGTPWYLHMPATVYVFTFGVVDIFYNFTIGTLVFVQLPSFKAPTLSQRLRVILQDSDELGWRWKLSYWVCRKLISPWDYNHCRVGLGTPE